jgi:hypothetical protein
MLISLLEIHFRRFRPFLGCCRKAKTKQRRLIGRTSATHGCLSKNPRYRLKLPILFHKKLVAYFNMFINFSKPINMIKHRVRQKRDVILCWQCCQLQ